MSDDLSGAAGRRGRLMPILLSESGFDDREQVDLATPVLPGLRLFMALDLPEGPHVLSLSEQRDLGGFSAVHSAAMENLAQLGLGGLELIRGENGARFHLVSQDSPYTAGLVTLLKAVVPVAIGRALPPEGVLVAVPTGRHLLFHPLEDLSVFGASLSLMGKYSHALCSEAADGLSPSVFWWRPYSATRVTSFEGGEPTITIDTEFQAVLESMEGRPAPASAAELVADPEGTRAKLSAGRVLLHFDLVLELTGGLLGSGHADIARLLARQAGKSRDRKVRSAGELADALLDAADGKAKRALSALKSLTKSKDPDVAAEATTVRGMVLEQDGQLKEAERHYRLGMAASRPLAAGRAALNLAGLLAGTGDAAGTVAALNAARACGVPDVAAQASLDLAVTHQRAGDVEMAMRYYLEAARAPVPDIATPAAYVLGELLRHEGRLEEARMALETVAASSHPLALSAVVQLGMVHLANGDKGEAAICFRSAAQGTNPDAAAHATLQLAIMAYNDGRRDEAVVLLGQAARSDNAQVREQAADIMRRLGTGG